MCIAILVLLASLLLPAFVSAKRLALMTPDVSNLRQFAMAREIYMSDSDCRALWIAFPLVEGGYVPESLSASKLDFSATGLGNVTRRHAVGAGHVTAFKDSYSAVGDLNGHEFIEDRLQEREGFGWLISPSNGMMSPEAETKGWVSAEPKGPYLRLTLSGGVLRRRFHTIRHPVNGEPCFASYLPFVDGDEWLFDQR